MSSQFPFIFAQSFYLNATSPNWDALILNDYESVFPLPLKSKFGFTYLSQPPFTSQLGAFGKTSIEIEQQFYNFIISNYSLIDLELNFTNKIISDSISPKNTYTVDYKKGYNLNQNSKRNISKALNLGLKVEILSAHECITLSQKLLNPFLINDIKLSSTTVSLFEQLLVNAISNKMLYSFKVIDSEQNIKALAHFICNGKHVLYLKGTNFDKLDNSGSMHLLIFHAIKFFENKADFFDFGGGSKKGLAIFYMGLGGEIMRYGFLQINKLPWFIKLFKSH